MYFFQIFNLKHALIKKHNLIDKFNKPYTFNCFCGTFCILTIALYFTIFLSLLP